MATIQLMSGPDITGTFSTYDTDGMVFTGCTSADGASMQTRHKDKKLSPSGTTITLPIGQIKRVS